MFFFFIGLATKIAVLVSWRTTPVSLANLMICSLKFKKVVLIFKMCFIFCAFGFEAIPDALLSYFQ